MLQLPSPSQRDSEWCQRTFLMDQSGALCWILKGFDYRASNNAIGKGNNFEEQEEELQPRQQSDQKNLGQKCNLR